MPTRTKRKYKNEVNSVQKMRAIRAINTVRWAIVQAAIEEEELDIAHDPKGREAYVHRHRKLQKQLAGHFPLIDIRDDVYASDISHALAKDITYFILHGDTPGQ